MWNPKRIIVQWVGIGTHIFGHTKVNDEWRIKYNNELYGEPDTAIVIKIGRLQWAGQVWKMINLQKEPFGVIQGEIGCVEE